MSELTLLHNGRAHCKQPPPAALTDDEMQRLLRAFLRGKTEVPEEDIMLVVQWAIHQRMGAVLLDLALDGDLALMVEHGEVKVAMPVSGGRG